MTFALGFLAGWILTGFMTAVAIAICAVGYDNTLER